MNKPWIYLNTIVKYQSWYNIHFADKTKEIVLLSNCYTITLCPFVTFTLRAQQNEWMQVLNVNV